MSWDDPQIAGYVEVPGGRIWYRANGVEHRDRTPLVAVAGGPGMSHHYMVPLLALAEERTVVLYDQLDTGNADRPRDPANWRIPRFVAEVGALREALGLGEVILLGHSWGALIAAEYALGRPDGLTGLILASPAISIARWERDTEALVADLPEDLRGVIADCVAREDFDNPEFARANREFGRRHICRTSPRPDFVVRSFKTFATPVYNAMWGPTEFTARGTLKSYEAADRIGAITVPTLLTCGEYDEVAPATCREFASLMPQATVAVIEEASHFTFAEKPEEYIAVVRRFLSTVEGG